MIFPRYVWRVFALGFVWCAGFAGTAQALSVLTVRYFDVTGGALHGAVVTIETTISETALWNSDIAHLSSVLDHEGTVTALVTGSVSADGFYTYTNSGLVGFNVNIDDSGHLYSVAENPLSNLVTVMRGQNALTFDYSFLLPSDTGIALGQPVLNSQLPPIASGGGSLAYNGIPASFGEVKSLGASTVPEPATALLLGLGAVGLAMRRCRGSGLRTER